MTSFSPDGLTIGQIFQQSPVTSQLSAVGCGLSACWVNCFLVQGSWISNVKLRTPNSEPWTSNSELTYLLT